MIERLLYETYDDGDTIKACRDNTGPTITIKAGNLSRQ